jgi:hypothetical protein
MAIATPPSALPAQEKIIGGSTATMTRRTTTWWLIGAILAMVPASILLIASGLALLAHLTSLAPAGNVGFLPDDYSRTMFTLTLLGAGFLWISVVAGIVAWAGALVNAHGHADRRWFTALLWSGIVGILTIPAFGIGALIGGMATLAYVVGGPDAITLASSPARARVASASVIGKSAITRWSIWGLVAMAAGPALALLVSRETNYGGFLHGHVWLPLALITAGVSIMVAGVIAETVSWWGELFNAHRLADRTWFNVLLWSGVVGAVTMPIFGLGALVVAGVGIAYLLMAPDATETQRKASGTSASALRVKEVL